MPEPLPVDVVTTWWDYLVGGVGIVSGIATAGALWVAALAYRRQADDERRRQARAITASVVREDQLLAVIVKNDSDAPIDRVKLMYVFERPISEIKSHNEEWHGLAPFEERSTKNHWPEIPVDAPLVGISLDFTDAAGHKWNRDTYFGLTHITRGLLGRLQERRRRRWLKRRLVRASSSE